MLDPESAPLVLIKNSEKQLSSEIDWNSHFVDGEEIMQIEFSEKVSLRRKFMEYFIIWIAFVRRVA